MSAGGSGMVRGNAISSNKGAPTNKNALTEQGDSLNYPRNYHGALKNTEAVTTLIDMGEVEEDVLDTLDWAKPLNFQEPYEKISPCKQTAEATYLMRGTVLEFYVIIPTGQYARPADWELILPVRFGTGDRNKFHVGRWLPVNNFFGHYLETITLSRIDDLKTIVHPRPSGSIAVYKRSIMKDMSANQLRIIQRDVLFDKTAVTGPDVHHRLNTDEPFTPYRHLVNRRNKFAHVLDGEENNVLDRVIQRNNVI